MVWYGIALGQVNQAWRGWTKGLQYKHQSDGCNVTHPVWQTECGLMGPDSRLESTVAIVKKVMDAGIYQTLGMVCMALTY